MAKPFIVSIPHSLGKAEALRRLKSGMARALTGVPFVKIDEPTWIADQMSFKVRALGQTASGTIDVTEDTVRLAVSLPLLLHRFAARVQGAITQGTRRLLERRELDGR